MADTPPVCGDGILGHVQGVAVCTADAAGQLGAYSYGCECPGGLTGAADGAGNAYANKYTFQFICSVYGACIWC